ncbi:MAG: glycosyltransferase [Gemmatimonadetes bacterium]|nr:glycosyltransferase [Gemmatimonadota bacterium]MYH17808.1 glycosyltransferase [Gemmatimonadota bacterium]
METTILPVSVVIPTYNREDRLPSAIRSVLEQTAPPAEIIVVDDGSTDDTPALVRTFPGVRYLRQENQGVSAARNHGIGAAKHEWIALLDSDDEWLPRKLERQWSALERDPRLRFCHTDEIWIRKGRRVNPMKKHAKYGGHIFHHCLPLCVISPSSVLIHRDLFERFGMFDPELPVCEDYDLWLRICAREPVLYVDEPLLLKFGGHEDQLSRAHWGMDRFRIRALEKLIQSGALEDGALTAALDTLFLKIDIYAAGAEKRRRFEEAARYRDKKRRFAAGLASLASLVSLACNAGTAGS